MGGSRDQTSTQESSPWAGQQPYLRDLFSQAQGLYNGGPQEYYPGQTVAPFSPHTMQGMDLMTQRALNGSPQQDAFGQYLQQQLGQQNIDPSQIFGYAGQAASGIMPGQQMMGQAGSAAAGMGQPNSMVGGAAGALSGLSQYGGLGEAQSGGNPAMGAPPTSGPVTSGNPYLNQMFDVASSRAGEAFNEQTMPAIAAMFGDAGRTGGGIQQQVAGNAARQFGRDLQGMSADIYAPAYEKERDRNLQAASSLGQIGLGQGNLQLGGLNTQLGAGQGLGQLGLGGLGAMTDMYGNMAQNQFRAGSLMPSFNDMQYGDISRLMGVGGMLEDQTGRLMGANQDRWNYGQQAPWQNLSNYANTVYGLPGGYGTQTSTTPGGSRLAGAVGGALSGAPLGGWGALGGAVLGGLL